MQVLTVNRKVNNLPQDTTPPNSDICWVELDGWCGPRIQSFRVEYRKDNNNDLSARLFAKDATECAVLDIRSKKHLQEIISFLSKLEEHLPEVAPEHANATVAIV